MPKQHKFIIAHWLGFCAFYGVMLFLLVSVQIASPVFAQINPKAASAPVIVVEEKAPAITIQFFGDMMLERNVAKAMGARGLDYIFENVVSSVGAQNFVPLLGGTDLTIANLEGPFAPVRIKTSKSIAFRFDPKLAEQLKAYGFSAFSLANNHSYDMGRANVKFTRQTLDKAGLGFFGDELSEGPEYTYVTNTIAFIGLHNTYHNLDLKKVEAALNDAREQAKLVVVNVHWGEEYKKISNKKQRNLAHWLIDHGADAIIGHHPHVVQEMEIYEGKPIFYSLGNFIFDQYFSAPTQEGLSVVLSFSSSTVSSIELRPFYSIKSKIFEMTGERKDKFLEWFSKNSRLGGAQIESDIINF